MLIGIDLSFIRPDHKNGGTESYIKNLMKGFVENQLQNQFICFIHRDIYEEYHKLYPEFRFVVYEQKGSHKVRTILFQTFQLPGLIRKYKITVMFFPTYTSGLRKNFWVPVIVNPHDIQFKYYPEYFSTFKKLYFDYLYKNSFAKSARIVAISEYVKQSLLQYYPKQCGEKIQVIHNPIDFDYGTAKEVDGVSRPYILTVNSLQKHKNLITLIKAFDKIHGQIPHQLVLVGIKVSEADALLQYIREHRLENRIIITGYLSDEQIHWLYKNAELFVTTSLYEGFGMTPIEAIGAGCPTISTKETSLEEVTMNLASYYEPATDENVLAECMMMKLKEEKDSAMLADYAQIAMDHYDKKCIAKKYFELFEGI